MVKPFTEDSLSDVESIRTFEPDIDVMDLKWHQDWEDRVVEFISGEGWKFQFDDNLPVECEGKFFIKAGTWHRLIKGNTPLVAKIIKS